MALAAREGRDPRLVARVASGWVTFGERQFVRGYVLLLPDPVVPHLNALAPRERSQFLADMAGVGDALLALTAAVRINYAMFGNLEPALHAHVVPRYDDEPGTLRTAHPWAYDWSAAPAFDPAEHGGLLLELRDELVRRGLGRS
jgi:diadenosine tetraphosphate (Ap4A) HIT family hydrolase